MGLSRKLSPEERRQGFILYYLMGDWDRWIKRRIEQIDLVTDSRVKRRISVDFRLHPEVFGDAPLCWDGSPIQYVPLTMLEKTPFMHFDLRDECGAAIPLLRQQKSAALAAATLSAAAKMHVTRRLLAADTGGISIAGRDLLQKIKGGEVYPSQIVLPEELESHFLDLCYLPFSRERYEEGSGAAQVWENLLAIMARGAAGGELQDLTQWGWSAQGAAWSPGQGVASWLGSLLSDPRFTELAFDFARLYLVCAPVRYEMDRRRILKLQYEEHFSEPGLREVALFRQKFPGLSKRIRRAEDRAEGMDHDHGASEREWIVPESTTNRWARRPTVGTKLMRGIGWRSKPFSFELPGMCLGGTFHFEFTAPDGTQLRRARIQARPGGASPGDLYSTRQRKRRRFARRYAGNVSRCHLYLAAPPQGTWGSAVIALRPSPSTIVRGAAFSSVLTTGLILWAYLAGDNGLSKRPATIIALLLLAPGLIAAQVARPNEHPVTTGMLFGLRFLAICVAGVAITAAALLGAHISRYEAHWPWGLLLAFTLLLSYILLRAWRLAGRDWPERGEV